MDSSTGCNMVHSKDNRWTLGSSRNCNTESPNSPDSNTPVGSTGKSTDSLGYSTSRDMT